MITQLSRSLALAVCLGFGWAVATPAQAADLGGDCCADLEERVAELEATTVRKGNRKVSVQISGHVAAVVMFWDDGVEDNVYVLNSAPSESRLRIQGSAKIARDWSAGYQIVLGIRGHPLPQWVNADRDDIDPASDVHNVLGVRQSRMWLRSESLGEISWGLQSTALDNLAFYGSPLGGWDQPDTNWYTGFTLNGSGTTVGGFTNGSSMFDETRRDSVRYTTPTLAGFNVQAAWGEDDYWDVALRYAGTLGDFKVNAAVGYGEDSEPADDLEEIKASGAVWHVPSGIFVTGAYVDQDYDVAADSDAWYVAAGIKKKLNHLGYTTIWGSYANYEDGAIGIAGITDSDADRWGVGIMQSIDAAALELVAMYQNFEADANVGAANLDIEDFDMFLIGGRIKF